MIRSCIRPRLLNLGGLALSLVIVCCSCVVVRVKETTARPLPEDYKAKTSAYGEAHTLNTETIGDRYYAHVELLSHDDLEGRGTGSDGIDLAAGYIAGQFAAMGIQPGGPNGTYFQQFSTNRSVKLGDDSKLAFEGCDIEAELKTDFTPFGFSAKGDFSGDLAFVGYGIRSKSAGFDDYVDIDVDGKVVLMLRREPSDFSSDDDVRHANFSTKIKLAKENGAVAVMITDRDPDSDTLMRFRGGGRDNGLPAIHVTRDLADRLLRAGGLASLEDLQGNLDLKGMTVSAVLDGVRANGTVNFKVNEMVARNVVGVLPGNGDHADEYVVIGGHYDHLGKRGDTIFNGADDNASGTAGVIEVARLFAHMPHRQRSLIFMAFTGEEIGLRGSRHFAQNPTVDVESIVAMLNMDMIGRLRGDTEETRLAIQGLGTGDSFEKIVERHTAELAIPYTPDSSAKGPSDHASFYAVGIPSLFFFTGIHEDYHQAGDDVEKINIDGAVQVIDLVFRIATDIVNADDNPQFAEVDQPAIINRGPGGPRAGGVVMGIMPDMEDDSGLPGWRVGRVFPGGGAEKSGMKEGDRILSVAGVTITGFGDYRKATGDKKPGDVVDVIVRRGKDEVTLKVELTARGG